MPHPSVIKRDEGVQVNWSRDPTLLLVFPERMGRSPASLQGFSYPRLANRAHPPGPSPCLLRAFPPASPSPKRGPAALAGGGRKAAAARGQNAYLPPRPPPSLRRVVCWRLERPRAFALLLRSSSGDSGGLEAGEGGGGCPHLGLAIGGACCRSVDPARHPRAALPLVLVRPLLSSARPVRRPSSRSGPRRRSTPGSGQFRFPAARGQGKVGQREASRQQSPGPSWSQ